jgi:1-phosphofructokinase family hexose kinase
MGGAVMIHVVQANPAMDRIEVLPRIELDAVNRAAETHVMPGGKGLNTARGIRRLGGDVAAYGFLGGWAGGFIRDVCRELGIEDRHTTIAGSTRVCMVIIERDLGRSTVLNEPGPNVVPQEAAALVDELVSRCETGDLVVLTGSLPPGVVDDYYAELVDRVQATGARAIVDSAGEPLRRAMARGPWMVKPNVRELGEALGVVTDGGDGPLLDAMVGQLRQGTEIVVVTQGATGLLVVTPTVRWRVKVPSIRSVNPIGSGDFFLAGFATQLERGAALEDATRFGAACAVANAMTVTPDLPTGVDLGELSERITFEEL